MSRGAVLTLILIAVMALRIFRNRKEADKAVDENFNQNGSGNAAPPRRPQFRRSGANGKVVVLLVLLVAVLAIIGGSVYQLREDQYAVITTFGVPRVVNTSGLKFKIPLIQRRTLVSKNVQGFPIGYRIDTNESVEDESVMISVDFNFVNVDFYVEYRVIDPVKYLYNSQDPVGILKMLCQSYIRDTIGLYKVDDVITTGKSEIQGAIKEKIVSRLELEDLGLELVNIAMQDAEPPTREVQQAFKAVETSKQEAETAINNANKYANEELPAAEADADEILRQAEAYKEARIAEANGQASRFTELYAEYSRFPEITRQRLYYEMISEIFPGMKVVILGEDGSELTTVLPLDEFVGSTESRPEEVSGAWEVNGND